MKPFGTWAQYERLALRVSASPMEVIRAARTRIAPENWHKRSRRDARHAFYRGILKHHESARNLVIQSRL